MVEFEAIRVGIAFLGTLVATYFDLFNNRNVPNLLTYSLVGIGILFNVIDGANALYVIITAAIIFILGYLLYINGQIGGADILLFVAIALLIPEQPNLFPHPKGVVEFPFIVSLFITSGILFATYMLLYYLPKIAFAIKKNEIKIPQTNLIMGIVLLALYALTINMLNQVVYLSIIYISIISIVVIAAVFFLLFKEFIIEKYFVENVPLAQIEEEDILATELMDKKFVSSNNLKKLITKNELAKLAALGLDKVPVYKNMPVFMPYILVALTILVIFGDPFLYAISISFTR